MKKSFMTRVLATGLSVAMAFSLSTATNLVSAEAATTPAMASKTFNLKVDGAAKNYKASAATQKSYKITKATVGNTAKATVKVNPSKKSIKVTPGSVAGSTVVTVTFKNNKTKKSVSKKYRAYIKAEAKPEEKPAEVLGLTGVTQKSAANFTLTFAKELDKIAVADLTLTRDDDKADIQIKAVNLDSTDKTKVSLDTYLGLTDGKSYTLTYTDADKKTSTATFTVSDGKLAAFGLTPLKVTYNVATALKYQKLDANGMVLGEKAVNSPDANVTVSFKFTNEAGSYYDNGKVFLPNIGDKATVTVVQHTYQYNADGSEKDVIKNEFEVEAVSAATTVEDYTYTVSINAPAWEKLTASTVNTKVCMEDTNYSAYFLIKDSNGNDVTANGYTVESSDNSIIIANGSATGASLIPVKEGSAVLIVKDANGNSVKTVNVQVVAKRVLSSVALNRGSVTLPSATAATDAQMIYVTGKDQYGAPFGITSIDVTNNLAVNASAITAVGTATGVPRIVFTKNPGTAQVAGTYGYSIKVNGSIPASATLKVAAAGNNKIGLDFTAAATGNNSNDGSINVVDSTVVPTTALTGNTLTATLVQRQNGGVVVKPVASATVSAIKVYKVGGSTYANATYNASTQTTTVTTSSSAITKAQLDAFVTTNSSLSFDIYANTRSAVTGYFSKTLPAGTYKIQATVDGQSFEESFEVKDNQAVLSAVVLNSTIDANDINVALRDEKNVKYYDATGRVADGTIVAVTAHGSSNGKNAYVKTVDVTIAVTAGANTRNVVITGIAVNRTFTTASGATWSGLIP